MEYETSVRLTRRGAGSFAFQLDTDRAAIPVGHVLFERGQNRDDLVVAAERKKEGVGAT
jgi:hypothetical protein